MFYFDADGFDDTDAGKVSTIGKKVALKSSTSWFHWNFTLAQSESIASYDCGYYDTTVNKFISLAKQAGSSGFAVVNNLPAEYSGRVKVYPSNLTFAIERLKFSDQKDYRCYLVYTFATISGRVVNIPIDFKPANLEVQGKLNF